MSLDISKVSLKQAFDLLGNLIDISGDLQKPGGTSKALEWCSYLRTKELPVDAEMILDYFEANAWKNQQTEKTLGQPAVWHWEQPEVKRQLFLLRRIVSHPVFDRQSKIFQCQTLTNLANALDFVGRFVEALEYWQRALNIEPKFGMALGNQANALYHYAWALYDGGHTSLFLKFSHTGFCSALSQNAFYEADYTQAKEGFLYQKEKIEKTVKPEYLETVFDLDGYSLGRSHEEKWYRQRCLRDRLFLNPLNDLGSYAIAARDILTLPTLYTSIEDAVDSLPPRIIGFFNNLKQEYATARWMFFDGVGQADHAHYSDKGVTLYDSLDYSVHSLASEKIKMAYRAAYSIFDKIAYFLNFYMKLGMKENSINFSKVWYKKDKILHDRFQDIENWPFRGLFWLSHDLFDGDLKEVAAPDAEDLYTIRNHLEHKYFKVHEFGQQEKMGPTPSGDIGYSVLRSDFEKKTLRVLKLVRAALIYLSLGVHREETVNNQPTDGLSAPMTLFTLDDNMKL